HKEYVKNAAHLFSKTENSPLISTIRDIFVVFYHIIFTKNRLNHEKRKMNSVYSLKTTAKRLWHTS
ncbi:MAG: hypothetical protein K1W03_08640, partial [Mailhella sp.]